MVGWWKKVKVLTLAGVLAGGIFAQAQTSDPQLPEIPAPVFQEPTSVIPTAPPPVILTSDQTNRSQSGAYTISTGTNAPPSQVISQPAPNTPVETNAPISHYEGDIVTGVQEIPNGTCETCSKPGAKWLVKHKIFGGKQSDPPVRTGSEGEGLMHGWLGPHCYAHHDDYYPCTTFWSQFCFTFGSCRNFYGNPCRQGPMPVPIPPGYSLPPGPYGY